MKFQISEEIKNKTTECPSDFQCLKDNEKPMCTVDTPMCKGDYVFEKSGLFIKPNTKNGCPYRMPYRTSSLCLCPVRLEIYKKYNL